MIVTERLILDDHRESDCEKLLKWALDEELTYLADDVPPHDIDEEKMRGFLTNTLMKCGLEDGKSNIRLGVYLKDDNFIGDAIIQMIDRYNGKCMIGYQIGEREYWNQGYATELTGGLLRFCFEDLGMNRVGAGVYAMNKSSMRVLEKNGFKQEGIIRNGVVKRGKPMDEYLYGILKEEWEGRYV